MPTNGYSGIIVLCLCANTRERFMRDENDFMYGDDETLEAVRRFEDSLDSRKGLFFDIIEFENIIDYYMNSDNLNKASKAVDIASRFHPNSIEIQIRKAELLITQSKFSEALSMLQIITRIDPFNGEALYLKGQVCLELGDAEAAESCFQKAISVPDNDKPYLLHRIAGLYQYSDNLNHAIQYLEQSYGMNSESLAVIFDLAYCYEQVNDYQKAELYYNKYLDINPFATNVWYNLGILYTLSDDFDRAIEAFDYAIAVDPKNASAYYNKANTLANNESYLAAIKCFYQLEEFEPNNPKLYCSIGECYEKLKDFDNALKMYRKSLGLNPALAEAYYGIGVVMLETKQYNMALDLIAKAKALDPENYDFWLGLAKVKYEMNRVDEALDAYHEAISLNPDEPDAYLGVAEILLYQDRLEDVELFYNRVALKFSQVPMLKVIRAAAFYLSNKPKEALDALRVAKMMDPLSVHDFLSIVPVDKDPDFFKKVNSL